MQLYGCCTEVIVKIKMVYVFETLDMHDFFCKFLSKYVVVVHKHTSLQ